mgnify:CR=1 FL=1
MRKTKIICTIGPASESEEKLRELMLAGMNVARFNFSHGSHKEQLVKYNRVLKVRKELGLPVATLLDTKGPEIRLRDFEGGKVELVSGQQFVLTTEEIMGTAERATISYKNLKNDINVGKTILIDDGLIEMTVEEIKGEDIVCKVINGGFVSNHKGVNVPGVRVKLPALTDKDKEDIRFGVDAGFDFVAASFVRNADAIREIREILDEKGSAMQIIAKIENEEGIENIDSIIEASDGIMVARGDMGVEIPAEKVPHIQKMIIRKCNLACKVVITATQMLDSMIRNPRPTRAEVSDVANAVYEGTDAVMLSGETAMGSYPIEAVRMMSQIAEESEKYLDYMFYQRRKVSAENLRNISNTVCYSSVATASDLEAPVIVAPSVSGFTTRMLSKWRPKALIAGLSPSMTAVRQMQLYWGVKPFHAKRAESTDALLFASVELLKEKGIVKEGEIVVATAGVVTRANRHEPVADTNIMRVMVVE